MWLQGKAESLQPQRPWVGTDAFDAFVLVNAKGLTDFGKAESLQPQRPWVGTDAFVAFVLVKAKGLKDFGNKQL
jgi:hypothetical protein